MKPEELKSFIKETVNEVLSEQLTDLDRLNTNINSNTMVGEAWNKMVVKLETVYD